MRWQQTYDDGSKVCTARKNWIIIKTSGILLPGSELTLIIWRLLRVLNYLKKLNDRYVIDQVKNIKLPEFFSERIIRERIIFSGRVQKIGFRLEIFQLANRLSLTGWVKNLNDKNVLAEIQGESDRVAFIIEFMKSLKRASVKEVSIIELEIKTDEEGFILVKE